MNIFLKILEIINYVFIGLTAISFLPQFFYIIFFFLKPKAYKPAKVQHKFGVIIPARNEAEILPQTIEAIRKQNYLAENVEIFVVCDNCTDNSVEVCKGLGVNVIERNNPDERRKGFALKYAFKKLLAEKKHIEGYIILDADSLLHPDFIARMNDAFDSGVEIGRGYCNAKNYTKNIYTGITALFTIRDNRFNCQARSALGLDQLLTGSGMLIATSVLNETNGWDCTSISEDAQFTLRRVKEGRKIAYVSQAVYYDEMQDSLKETYNRTKRMGFGLFRLFFTDALPVLGKFFKTFKFRYLDMFLNLLFIPIACIVCIWFPLYYTFLISYFIATGNVILLAGLGINILNIVIFTFLLPFILQGLLAVLLERDKLPYKFSKLLPSILCFPFFMIIYALSICIGALSRKCEWKITKHSAQTGILELVGGGEKTGKPTKQVCIKATKVNVKNNKNARIVEDMFGDATVVDAQIDEE